MEKPEGSPLANFFNKPKAERQKIMDKVIKQSIESQQQVIREADLKKQAQERAGNQPIPAISTQDLEVTEKGLDSQEVTEDANDQ